MLFASGKFDSMELAEMLGVKWKPRPLLGRGLPIHPEWCCFLPWRQDGPTRMELKFTPFVPEAQPTTASLPFFPVT